MYVCISENIFKHYTYSPSLNADAHTMWVNVAYQEHVYFELQACSDAPPHSHRISGIYIKNYI